ncbi:hypothetical protein [Nocardiopsis sp. FR26]|uniref:hypothetical protein n=1 Tax=Nocardiopsis sp. FR26 TaxID=2605987 RepID=UPI00135B0CAC|nr:hypothetical protein [Nocardiopsis sp. FR26]
MFENTPKAITPWHQIPENLSTPIPLHEGNIIISTQVDSITIPGRIDWKVTSRPGARFTSLSQDDIALAMLQIKSPDLPTAAPEKEEDALSIPDCQPVEDNNKFDGNISDYSTSPVDHISRAKFLIPNFLDVVGETVETTRKSRKSYRRARISLKGEKWSFTIDPLPELDARISFARENSGYSFTHVGVFSRTNGSMFDSKEARDALNLIGHFLSFCTGRWVYPALPVGLDGDDNAIWSSWSRYKVDPWEGRHSFPDNGHVENFAESFKRFESMWESEDDHQAIFSFVNYYIGGNRPNPIETALILSQSGLELLSWVDLVENQQILTKDEYYKNRAHENIRMFLKKRSIPVDIPGKFHLLADEGASRQKFDGPEVLTYLRNKVTHPKKNGPKFTVDVWYQAWKLSQEFLLLGGLSFMGYASTYRSFLDENKSLGAVTQTPWQ